VIRDIQNSEVLAVIERAKGRPAPKPTRATRPKKSRKDEPKLKRVPIAERRISLAARQEVMFA
jgi:hypothetical protein